MLIRQHYLISSTKVIRWQLLFYTNRERCILFIISLNIYFFQTLLKSIIQERDRSMNITIEQHLSYMNHPGVRERYVLLYNYFTKV